MKALLKGCRRLYSKPVCRKEALPLSAVIKAIDNLPHHPLHDDLLFVAMLATGFYGLLRLGEMVAPDSRRLRNSTKFTSRFSAEFVREGFSFELRSHKTDQFFEGARIIIPPRRVGNPLPILQRYLISQDKHFNFDPFLWM